MRRSLRQVGVFWRRPRPLVGSTYRRRAEKLRKITALLRDLPADETAVFRDEADVNSNPEIGGMWMYGGQQAAVVTPGTNVKRSWPARCTGALGS